MNLDVPPLEAGTPVEISVLVLTDARQLTADELHRTDDSTHYARRFIVVLGAQVLVHLHGENVDIRPSNGSDHFQSLDADPAPFFTWSARPLVPGHATLTLVVCSQPTTRPCQAERRFTLGVAAAPKVRNDRSGLSGAVRDHLALLPSVSAFEIVRVVARVRRRRRIGQSSSS